MAIYTIQLKRGLAKSWDALDPILEPGEPGMELDTGKLKIGDGVKSWKELKYVGEDGTGVVNAATHFDFPSIGDANVIYKAEEEKKIYQWNSVSMAYEVVNEERSFDDIEIINGGNANGTD